jgi:hypothetical protein
MGFLDLLGLLVGPAMPQGDNPSRTTRRRSTVRTDNPAAEWPRETRSNEDLINPLFTTIHGTDLLPPRASYITNRATLSGSPDPSPRNSWPIGLRRGML